VKITNHQPSDEKLQRTQASCNELVQQIARVVRADGVVEVLPGLKLSRRATPTALGHVVWPTSFCVIAQGSKEVLLGDERYHYDPAHYLIATATLPVASRIIEASPERPYLGLVLTLDPALVSSVMVEADSLALHSQCSVKAINVSPLDAALLDAVVRLVRLIDTPKEARFLAPLITREIIYRLLVGEQSSRLRYVTGAGGNPQRIAEAIARLHQAFDQPLRMEEMARELGMSVSSFHHHFKAVTSMSPLQFQKHLRLQEARRLMLGERLDANSAGYRVGYDDTSHFNREYKSLFGVPPRRDVERLRGSATESVARF
jgi:AraC-like DNA-binding protein